MKKASILHLKRKQIILVFILFFLNLYIVNAQYKNHINATLKQSIIELTNTHHAIIGISIINIETGDSLMINDAHHYPMQSVYKFPQAMAVLNQVDKGFLSLELKIHVSKKDLLPETWSPLKQKYPDGNVDLTIADLLYYSVSLSDNIACDLLFKVMKGPKKVNQYIHQLGLKEIAIVATEHQMHSGWKYQYQNWCKPSTMTLLLKGFYEKKYLSDSSSRYLMHLMTASSNSFLRIKGLLPSETIVAHKTGSSDTNSLGMRAGLNDVGIITMPNGQHIAISVFVSDSYETYEKDEKIIALIARATYDYYIK